MGRAKRIWYLSPVRAAKVQASLRIRAVSPEPSLLAHTSSESRGTFRQKARSLAPLNGWACAVEICHDGMLEDTNSLDAAHINQSQLYFLAFRSSFNTITLHYYCNVPKFSDRQVCSNSVDPEEQSDCHSICIFWMHYSMVNPPCLNFRVITTNFPGVHIFRVLRYAFLCLQ